MRLGYTVLTALMAVLTLALVLAGKSYWWMPLAMGVATFLLGLYQRHLDAEEWLEQVLSGLKPRLRKGWF